MLIIIPLNSETKKINALNFAEIRNKLAEQRQIILSYKEYYEGDDK